MSYNLLNYPHGSPITADTTKRNPYFRTTIAAVNPDILVVGEITSQAGVNGFLSNVMNQSSNAYAAGTFIDGSANDTENGIFYKTSKFHFVSNTPIKTALRDINEFKLVHLLSGDTIRIYAVHLKSSDTPGEDSLRAAEVDSLRKVTNALPAGSDFIVCGDFNIYRSSSLAYQRLLATPDNGKFIDPISMPGNWNDSLNYRSRSTQSTRVTTWLNDGGSTGGLDDRFDLILYSKEISLAGGITYVANSEIPYGNDGSHYNDSINKMPNTAVTQAVANALYFSSDHIPVLATFNFEYGATSPPDLGVLSLVTPVTPMCAVTSQSLQVQVKNYSASDVNFGVNNMQVSVTATNPSSVNQSQSKTINSGTLTAGAVMTVTMDNPYNMSTSGSYIFNANTVVTGDVNNSNNAMPAKTIIVNANPAATVSPAGPLSFCSGSSATLTASGGTSFLWSTGATTQSINVNASGNYSVTVTSNGCSSPSSPVSVTVTSGQSVVALFTETVDTVPGGANPSLTITTYESTNGFDNDNLYMYGSGEVRNSNASSGYATASGAGNVFLTNTSAGRYFVISGINTTGLANLELSFGIFKSAIASTGADFSVGYSTDSTNYTPLSIAALPSGSGTATWYYRTATGGPIPAVPNLRLRFRNDSTSTQFRIDDIVLKSSFIPIITASGPTTFCVGDSVTLTASSGSSYLWSTGATTQSIKAYASGSYTVTVNCVQSSPVVVTANSCGVTLNLKVFFEGLYMGNDEMQPVLYTNGLSNDPTACDSITVEVHDAVLTDDIIASARVLLHTDGNTQISFPAAVSGRSLYLVIHHRNSIEIWSKHPVDFNSAVINFDFTTEE